MFLLRFNVRSPILLVCSLVMFTLPSLSHALPYTAEQFNNGATGVTTGFANTCTWEKVIDWGDVGVSYDNRVNEDTYIETYVDRTNYLGGYQVPITTSPGFNGYITFENKTPFDDRQVHGTIALDNANFGNPTVNDGTGGVESDDVMKFTRIPNVDNDDATSEALIMRINFPKKYAYYSYKVYDVDQAGFTDSVNVTSHGGINASAYTACGSAANTGVVTGATNTELTGTGSALDNDTNNYCYINDPDTMVGPNALNDLNSIGGTVAVLEPTLISDTFEITFSDTGGDDYQQIIGLGNIYGCRIRQNVSLNFSDNTGRSINFTPGLPLYIAARAGVNMVANSVIEGDVAFSHYDWLAEFDFDEVGSDSLPGNMAIFDYMRADNINTYARKITSNNFVSNGAAIAGNVNAVEYDTFSYNSEAVVNTFPSNNILLRGFRGDFIPVLAGSFVQSAKLSFFENDNTNLAESIYTELIPRNRLRVYFPAEDTVNYSAGECFNYDAKTTVEYCFEDTSFFGDCTATGYNYSFDTGFSNHEQCAVGGGGDALPEVTKSLTSDVVDLDLTTLSYVSSQQLEIVLNNFNASAETITTLTDTFSDVNGLYNGTFGSPVVSNALIARSEECDADGVSNCAAVDHSAAIDLSQIGTGTEMLLRAI